jgi:uncharacterized membrane protein (DUF485 family)
VALFQPARRDNSSGTDTAGIPQAHVPQAQFPQSQPARHGATGYEAIYASRDFWTIRRRSTSFIVPACVTFLAWYFLFVIVAVFAPGFMRIRMFGEVNVGLCFGVLQFTSTFTIAVWYRYWAQHRLDPPSERLRRRLEGGRY